MHFFLEPAGISFERARALDPDRDWTDLRRGKEVWILQTYLRLRRLGYPVALANTVPSRGLVVYHKEEQQLVLERLGPGAAPVLIAVRGDFRSADAADFEILQNGCFADGDRAFFIPHWPQPGLIRRDAARGTRVSRIAFKGYAGNLAADFRSAEFARFLRDNALEFACDAVVDDASDHPILADWHDYREVDVALALRPGRHTHKPASKLQNAWLAGVPAVLSPDSAYRELRRSPLDYLEARSVEEAKAAVLRLRSNPDLYRRMVENGRERARDFTVEKVTDRWVQLLFDTLPAAARRYPERHYALGPRRLRTLLRKASYATRGTPRK
ncbi:MAG: glycosyltransferase [Thermoanaerobaculaceae bacterium]